MNDDMPPPENGVDEKRANVARAGSVYARQDKYIKSLAIKGASRVAVVASTAHAPLIKDVAARLRAPETSHQTEQALQRILNTAPDPTASDPIPANVLPNHVRPHLSPALLAGLQGWPTVKMDVITMYRKRNEKITKLRIAAKAQTS